MCHSSPVATLRLTENWVRIPLKEITDANKLFGARRRVPSRAKDKTLCNFTDRHEVWIPPPRPPRGCAGVDTAASPPASEPELRVK